MEIRVLRYFLVVAQEENITKAAQLLHITQPTLSRQLMQLEEELGVKLFLRNRHNISLTDDGLLLRRRAEELVSLADKTIDDFSSKEHEIAGTISIGAGEFLGVDKFCRIMNMFHEENPLIHYEMHSDNREGIEERVANGLLDFGVLVTEVDINKYDFLEFSHQENWGILVREDSPLASKEAISLSDLYHQPLIIPKNFTQRTEIVQWFQNEYQSLNIIANYNLLYNAAMMVSNGLGAAICVELKSHYDHLRFIPFTPALHTNLFLIWKKNQTLSLSVSTFLDYVKKYQKSISN